MPVLSKHTYDTHPDKFIRWGSLQNISFFLNLFNAIFKPIYNVVGSVGGTQTATKSKISVIKSNLEIYGYFSKNYILNGNAIKYPAMATIDKYFKYLMLSS